MQEQYKPSVLINQDDLLSDKTSTGRERPWNLKKNNSLFLSDIYDMAGDTEATPYILFEKERLGSDFYYNLEHYDNISSVAKGYYRKAIRIENCGKFLDFMRNIKTNEKRLKLGNFCKIRLCPMCNWRRALKVFGQVNKVMEYLQSEYPKARYIFATLTVKNVEAEYLSDTISEMIQGFYKLIRNSKLSKNLLGAYRAIEVTYNKKENTYHPHIHAIFMVSSNYYKSKDNYVTQKELCDIWAKKMKLDYKPLCDIRKVKSNTAKAVAEVAKYSVKDSDYLDPEDVMKSIELVKVLDSALKNKRLVAFYGAMKEAHKLLNLDDVEDGKLEKTDNDEDLLGNGWILETYAFNTGYRMYVKV